MAKKVFLDGSVFWWVLVREVTAAGFGLSGEHHYAAQTFVGALTLICGTPIRRTSKPEVSSQFIAKKHMFTPPFEELTYTNHCYKRPLNLAL